MECPVLISKYTKSIISKFLAAQSFISYIVEYLLVIYHEGKASADLRELQKRSHTT